MRLLSVVAAFLLVGCGGIPALPETVKVPVAVSCVKVMPARPPPLTEAALAGLNDYDFVVGITADWLRRKQYEAELEAVLEACR